MGAVVPEKNDDVGVEDVAPDETLKEDAADGVGLVISVRGGVGKGSQGDGSLLSFFPIFLNRSRKSSSGEAVGADEGEKDVPEEEGDGPG